MSDQQKQQQDTIMKSLAIAGFIAIILAISWLSVQFVQLIPSAFSSLASLAGNLQQQAYVDKEEEPIQPIILTSDVSSVAAGQTVELTWEDVERPGSYTFSYECTDGVAVDLINIVGIQSIACDTNYNIGDRNALSFTVDSEKEAETSVVYTLAFLGTNDLVPTYMVADTVLIKDEVVVANDDTDTSEVVDDTETEVNPEPTTPVTVAPQTQTPVTPVTTQQFVYQIPVSDPNGRTDLGVRFIQTGTISGNRFIAGLIERNDSGAIQIAVKNYGTKTSDEWSYSVTLPSGGTYEADDQKPLKPNEEAIISIGFTTDNSSSHTFRADIDESTDRNRLNDQFEQTVFFIR